MAAAPHEDPEVGGDPVCWLERVCKQCGAFRGEREGTCPRCGAEAPAER